MKILMIDKFYFIQGGVERYYFELKGILESAGHTVIPFSMKHPKNFENKFSQYFVDNVDYNSISALKNPIQGSRAFLRMVYSLQAKRKIECLINKTKPDIAHIHMIDHQISPSILDVLKKNSIPVIQTVHQYKLVCPSYLCFNNRTKKVCEKCLGRHYYHPIFERCHKNSALAGLMLAVEATVHKILNIYERNIDIFHVPSNFMGNKLKQGGINPDKIEHLFYTINIRDYKPNYNSEDYFVFCGRLSVEKGILTLLKAMRNVNTSRLVVVGDGPQRKELEEYVSKNGLSNVEFTGYKSGNELKSIVSNSKFVVLPSECYDNSPLSIYESSAMGKPAVGSDMGGIPELVEDGRTGVIFKAGDHYMLSQKINYMLSSVKRLVEYGKRARQKAENEFSPDIHYKKMMKKYKRLIDSK